MAGSSPSAAHRHFRVVFLVQNPLVVSFEAVGVAPIRLDSNGESEWLDVTLEEPQEQIRMADSADVSAVASGATAPFG